MYLLRRAGFSQENIIGGSFVVMMHAAMGGRAEFDPTAWNDRTYQTAHSYISDRFDFLAEGDVIDVEYILNETSAPKRSEFYNEGPIF